MGRDWSWGGRSTNIRRAEREASGCMSSLLQLFDFHQFQFPLVHQPCFKSPDSFLQEDYTILEGIEAPRNSLESEEGASCMGTAHLSSILKEDDLNLPMAIRLGTKLDNARRGDSKACMEEISSETSTSPMTKSPSLVARLMGLDLLPDSFSPSSSSTFSSRRTIHSRSINNINFIESEAITGTRSLPDTPRISSARRSSDMDPRLSLQLNKENLMISPEEFASTKSRKKEWRQGEGDQNRNPSYYAQQVVKQVKENVSRRKVGLDITNTSRNGANPRLQSHTKVGDESSPGKNSTPSSRSPRPIELQPKAPRKPKAQPPTQTAIKTKCKKGSSTSERFTQRLTKPPQISETVRTMREEAFVPPTKASNLSGKNSKKASLSHDLVNKESFTNQKSVAQGSKRRSQLSSCLRQKYYNRQEGTEMLTSQDDNKWNSNSRSKNGGNTEFRYVNGILKSTGIYRDAFFSLTRWFSPSHPLNPLIFHHLEHSFTYSKMEEREDVDQGSIKHRCNRKLLFQLVDELLLEVLTPYLNMKPWLRSIHRELLPENQMTGQQLLERLWSRIQSFPAADCQILQDIDALVEKDLPEANMRTVLSYSEEGESIVFEIERDILDSLLHEIAAALLLNG